MYASIEAAMMFVLVDWPMARPSPRAPPAADGGAIVTVTRPSASGASPSALTA